MKTPLSFLSKLMGRGRSAKPQLLLSPPVSAVEPAKTEDEAVTTPDEIVTVSAASIEKAHVADEVMAESVGAPPYEGDVQLPPDEELALIGDEGDQPVTIDGSSPPTAEPPPPAGKRRGKQGIRVKAQSTDRVTAVAARVNGNDEDGQSPPPFVRVVSEEESLDAEIAELRRQLAQKLQLQNSQLKMRLARFDRF